MEVTRSENALSRVPILLAITPFPIPLITPPVTNIYFIFEFTDVLMRDCVRLVFKYRLLYLENVQSEND